MLGFMGRSLSGMNREEELVRMVKEAMRLMKRPYYGYLEDRVDNYYEGYAYLEQRMKEMGYE